MRRVQRGNGCHGKSVSRPGKAAERGIVSIDSLRSGGRLRDSTAMGRWSFDGTLLVRLSASDRFGVAAPRESAASWEFKPGPKQAEARTPTPLAPFLALPYAARALCGAIKILSAANGSARNPGKLFKTRTLRTREKSSRNIHPRVRRRRVRPFRLR